MALRPIARPRSMISRYGSPRPGRRRRGAGSGGHGAGALLLAGSVDTSLGGFALTPGPESVCTSLAGFAPAALSESVSASLAAFGGGRRPPPPGDRIEIPAAFR